MCALVSVRSLVLTAAFAASLAVVPAAQADDMRPDGTVLGVAAEPVLVDARCAELQADGARAMVMSMPLTRFVEPDGSYDFSFLDKQVDRVRSCGMEVAARVFVRPASAQDRGMPEDLAAYGAAVGALVTHMKGRVRRYSFENEVTASSHWEDTPEDYFALLATASAAVRAPDPSALVLDGVFSSGGLYVARADQLWRAGDTQGAYDLLREMQVNELGGGPELTSPGQVAAYLSNPKVLKMVAYLPLLAANAGLIDRVQIHHYGPWQRLPELVGMVRQAGVGAGLELWELGHRYRDGRPFDPTDHAAELVRLLVTAAGLGSQWSIYQKYVDYPTNGIYGLYDEAGTPRLARDAYRVTSGMLSGALLIDSPDLGAAVVAHRFDTPGGLATAIFAESEAPLSASPVSGSSTVAVTDGVTGATRHVSVNALAAGPVPSWIRPDLLRIRKVRLYRPVEPGPRRPGKGRPARVMPGRFLTLAIECPPASATVRCAGRLKVSGGRGNHVRLAQRKVRLIAGGEREITLRLARKRARPRVAVMSPYRCVAGPVCRSWVRGLSPGR